MKTWIALLLFASLAQCPAADALATLAELRTALREELKSALDKGNIENNQRLFQLESLLVESLPDKELPDEKMAQTIQALLQVRAISRDKKVGELSEKLVDELRTQARAAAKRLQENFNTTLARCIRDGLKATKPHEVDAPLKEIAGLKRQLAAMQNRNSDVQTAFNSQGLQTIEGLLNACQDLLFAAEKGLAATNSAQRLTGEYSYRELGDIIPRSELLELTHQAQARLPKKDPAQAAMSTEEFERQVSAIIGDVKKLEEIEAGVKKIEELIAQQRKVMHLIPETTVVAELKTLRRFHQEIVSGVATTLDFSITGMKAKDENISRLRNMLIRFAIPRLFGLTGEQTIKEDESLAVFIRRTATEATERRDWKLLSRALDLNQRLATGQSPLNTGDSSAITQFLAAQNQERARQYGPAVGSYLAALKTGSQIIPAEFIGDRLAAIEKEHPNEYQAAVEFANNPPPARYTATSGAPKTVFGASGDPQSQVSATLPMRVVPRPTPTPASAPTTTEPKPPTLKPEEPKPTEKKPDSEKQ